MCIHVNVYILTNEVRAIFGIAPCSVSAANVFGYYNCVTGLPMLILKNVYSACKTCGRLVHVVST